jgi:hypothetical protein
MRNEDKNRSHTPGVQREVSMASRVKVDVPITLAGLDVDRMNRAKHWADRNEMDWYRPR